MTTGCAGLEGSPLGLGGVMLGGEAEVGLDPAASCCLTDCGNLEQHFGQVGFRQAKGWDTWREKFVQRLDNDKKALWPHLRYFRVGRQVFKSCCRFLFRLGEIMSHQYGCASLAERRHLQIPLLTILFCILNGCACIIWQLAGRGWGARVGVPGG